MEVGSSPLLLLKDAVHLVFIEFNLEEGRLKEVHLSEVVTLFQDQVLLEAPHLILLLFKDGDFIEETLPFDLIDTCDFCKAVRDVFDHIVELFNIYLHQDTGRTNTSG